MIRLKSAGKSRINSQDHGRGAAQGRQGSGVPNDWKAVVPERNAFEQMFSGKEVLDDVTVYTDWRSEIMSVHNLIAVYVFGFR